MGWAGNIILLVSMWLVGSKKKSAFFFGVIGNFIWALVGWEKGMHDLVFIGIIMVIFNIRGWKKWSEEDAYVNSMRLPQYRRKWWQIWK